MLSFPAMSYLSLSPSEQFETAEYVGTAGGDQCLYCHQPIGTIYYLANAAIACPSCAAKLRNRLGYDWAAPFGRAVLYGTGAAALGLALYAAFMIITHIDIGYASLAVGWMVAKAMVKGSGGIAGRRYQIVAGILTYAACTLARIPVWIYQMPERRSVFLTDIPHTLLFPFLRLDDAPFQSLIGLVILFVGVSIAFRLTAAKAFTIDGPYANSWPARG
jgi:hypothetical protein